MKQQARDVHELHADLYLGCVLVSFENSSYWDLDHTTRCITIGMLASLYTLGRHVRTLPIDWMVEVLSSEE